MAPIEPGLTASGTGGRRQNVLAGILLMTGASLVFGGINVIVKWLGDTYPPTEILFFRNVFALPFVIWLAWRQVGTAVFRTRRIDLHLIRGFVGVTSLGLLFWSFTLMPLADATALSFAAPLFTTLLSIPILGEKVGPVRWLAVLVGLLGVVIMARPTGEVALWAAMLPVTSAFLFAVTNITIRMMKEENSAVVTLWYTTIATALSGLVAPIGWVTPDWPTLLVLLGCGLAGGLGQYMMSTSFAIAPLSATSPFNYTIMLWAVVFGWLIWDEVPGATLWIGAVLVVGSGIIIVWRESRRTGGTV